MPLLSGTRGNVLGPLLAGSAAALLAYLTTVSAQLGLTAALVALTYGLYVAQPRAAMVLVWLVWLLTPGIRRMFGLSGYLEADPLSVAPFLVTGLVAVLEWSRRAQPVPVRRVALLVLGGWLVGLPAGIVAGPAAALYNLVAYGVAAGAYVIGWHERARGTSELTLIRTLAVAAPVLAAYGIAQYLLPLTPWDRTWLTSVDVITFLAPDGVHVRVFSTLNAPGILAPVLGLALVWHLTRPRLSALTWAAAGVVLFALSLTYVRAAWLALAVGLLAASVTAGRQAVVRLLAISAVAVVAVIALAPVNQTAAALAGRFETFGSLGEDTSANARTETTLTLVPESAARPLGHGLGTAGEGSKLGGTGAGDLRAPDNGYLSLLYQAGPAGALLVLAGLAIALRTALRRAWDVRRRRPREAAYVVGASAFILVMLLSGDHFYGVVGVVLWYVLGAAGGALWRDEVRPRAPAPGASWPGRAPAPARSSPERHPRHAPRRGREPAGA